MSAYGEIVSMLTRIQLAVDNQDRETFADCWTEDVKLHIGMADGHTLDFNSREELVSRTTGNWTGQPSAMRHLVGAVDVRMTGENTATAHFYCNYINVGDTPSLVGLGEYRDELRRDADGKWRVSVRKHAFLTPLALRL